MAEYDRGIEDSFDKILFVPSAYKVRRGTAFKTPSSPSRGARHTPGRTTSRTPPPPPLNHDDEPLSHGSFASPRKLGRRSDRPGVGLTGLGGFTSHPDRPSGDERRDNSDVWIKVCGVLEDDHSTVMRHFRRYGDVEQYIKQDDSIRSNYVFIKFKNSMAAASALMSNGKTIDGRRCFGVVCPSNVERHWLQDRTVCPPTHSTPLAITHDEVGETSGTVSSLSVPVTVPSAPPEPTPLPPVQSSGSTILEYYMRFIFG